MMSADSLSQIKRSFIRLTKERFYESEKLAKKAVIAERREIKQAKVEAGLVVQNKMYPYLHRRITSRDLRAKSRNSVALSIINNNPSIVFDFRYEHVFKSLHLMSSLYRQYIEIISNNR